MLKICSTNTLKLSLINASQFRHSNIQLNIIQDYLNFLKEFHVTSSAYIKN